MLREILNNLSDEEFNFLESLYTNGKVLITYDKNVEVPEWATHILVLKAPQLIRKKFNQ